MELARWGTQIMGGGHTAAPEGTGLDPELAECQAEGTCSSDTPERNLDKECPTKTHQFSSSFPSEPHVALREGVVMGLQGEQCTTRNPACPGHQHPMLVRASPVRRLHW